MSDDSARTPPDAGEDAFSRAFRERWGDLADRAERLESDAVDADAENTADATPGVRRDPTAALPTANTGQLPVTPQPEATTSAPSGQPTPAYGPPTGQPYSTYRSAPPPPQPGDPYPSYGPRVGEPYPAYGHHPQTAPSAAALLVVSGVTMVFTMMFIGLPSLIAGAVASGAPDPETKARRIRLGWILYAVNWAFVVLAVVLLVVGLVVYMTPA